jgi:uncharacterized protein YidB (DUF937 family)
MAGIGRMALVALAILAYSNRNKIADLAASVGHDPNNPNSRGGLGELLDRLRNAGQGDAVDSWVGTGPNQAIEKSGVEHAIDNETLDSLIRQTGMPREELLERLARNLPDAVNDLTPDGHIPEAPMASEPTLLDPAEPIHPSKL